ncbi:hypothetical protein KDAU_34240 [Dictyobacter aurantiacus]|uniref:Uncharacterized protein n=1 Tax=Dictyobacter aurantiacus TaxID=1936993 RepID=A0A401ZGT9_9CHLR|nr:hypothetical protein KDAU_34240 [Dictyobacter aurantiacus]
MIVPAQARVRARTVICILVHRARMRARCTNIQIILEHRSCETSPPGVPPTAEFTRQYLEKYKEKVFVVRNNADRERLLSLLEKDSQAMLQ